MHSDFHFYYCFIGGGADRVFGDAVLCTGILYFFSANVSTVRIFVVVEFDGVCGGERAGTISLEGASNGSRADAGAANSVHSATCSFNFGARGDLGGGDVANNYV